MTSSSRSLVDRERAGLADLLDRLGPDAPTCCAGWTTAHLAAHLVVRERRPDAMPGLAVETLDVARPLTAWAHRLEDRLRESTSYPDVVARVRSGPPAWSPLAWPLLARLVNTAEFAVHHEDARRAQPEWAPRPLDRADQDELWGAAVLYARRATGRVPGGLRLRRSDVPGMVRRISRAEPATTVEGEPLELLLWASGREDVARVEIC
ncbi:TIGR03085 family metal-binding protein [Geodermatophilus sp. SYSU D00079]